MNKLSPALPDSSATGSEAQVLPGADALGGERLGDPNAPAISETEAGSAPGTGSPDEQPEAPVPPVESLPPTAPTLAPTTIPEAEPVFAVADEQIRAVRDELAALRGLFEAKILKDRGQQQVIDKLHGSLKDAEADLVWNIRRPILVEIVQLYDDLTDEAAKPGAPEAFGRYIQDIEDLLYRLGVEPYRAAGEQFDARTQVVRRKVPAPTAAHVGTVAASLRPGFKTDRHTLRPEVVAVHVRAQTTQTTVEGGESQ